jgi:hypothetical protein
MSTVYQQASHREKAPNKSEKVHSDSGTPSSSDPMVIDPGNQLLWRMRLRRLESEIIRDSILAVSGELDRTIGGPPILIETLPDGRVVVSQKDQLELSSLTQGEKVTITNPKSRSRRSLYLLSRRNYNQSMLSVFDQPVMSANCTRRNSSAVVLQSLTMMNDEFVLEQAKHMARRVASRAGDALEQRIEQAFWLALGREPNSQERDWSQEFLTTERDRLLGVSSTQAEHESLISFCHVLMNTSEFLYVE